MGLCNEGDDVSGMIATVQLEAKKIVPNRFLDKRTGLILIDELIKNIVDTQSYDDDFVRRAVLVLMGTVLAPQSTKFVPYRYYKMVEDVNAIKSYNWNDFTLGVCMDAIKKRSKILKNSSGLSGTWLFFRYKSFRNSCMYIYFLCDLCV